MSEPQGPTQADDDNDDEKTAWPDGENPDPPGGALTPDPSPEGLELGPSEGEDEEDAPEFDRWSDPTRHGLLKKALESLVFVSDRIVTHVQLARIVGARPRLARSLLQEIVADTSQRGVQLVEVSGGYQYRTAPETGVFVRELVAQKPVRLSRAQLETLALVAYRQPITRPEVDEVRGVDTGSAIKVLLDRGLIKMIGRKDEAGRPLLYGTTPYFLEFFGLASLRDLPTLKEFTELSDDSRTLFKRKTGETVEQAESELARMQAADEEPDDAGGEAEQGPERGTLAQEHDTQEKGRASEHSEDDAGPPHAELERGEPSDER